ncbi:RNA binding protein [Cyclospora cayetanensis]|uniref:RNA binding protein n=1 Tax=Cyclospora cayetanensis TaxID=88456 RepID=A0A1D3DAD0_9EIME|nr:RNA binding protein [Cyclospora cayetanensis]
MSHEGGNNPSTVSSLLGLTPPGLDFCLSLKAGGAGASNGNERRSLPILGAPLVGGKVTELNKQLADGNVHEKAPLSRVRTPGVFPSSPFIPPPPPIELRKTDSNRRSRSSEAPGLAAPAPPVQIKLFVGGLPPSVDEIALRILFSLFGSVTEVVVLRDKVSNRHRNCAFVRMRSLTDADRAIRELGRTQNLGPPLDSLSVRYAAGEAERLGFPSCGYGGGAMPGVDEAKLFVGSLPKDVKEHEVRALFEQYGSVQEVFLLRHNNGDSGSRPKKGPSGSAFVRFAYKEQALHAISSLAGRYVMPNVARGLEVRFAAARRRQPASNTVATGSGLHALPEAPSENLDRETLSASARQGVPESTTGDAWLEAEPWEELLSLAGEALGFPQQANSGKTERMPLEGSISPVSCRVSLDLTILSERAILDRPADFSNWIAPHKNRGLESTLLPSLLLANGPGLDVETGNGVGSPAVPSESYKGTESRLCHEEKSHGPPGANLFILHIPNEWTGDDLLRHFSPFGALKSAKIAVDRHTRRNRGFAFVDYQDVNSAIAAVSIMDGYQVNGKRLKVRIKTEEAYEEALMLENVILDRHNRLLPQEQLLGGSTRQEDPQTLAASLLDIAAKNGSIAALLEESFQQSSEQTTAAQSAVSKDMDELSGLLSRSLQLCDLISPAGLVGLPAENDRSNAEQVPLKTSFLPGIHLV